MPRAKTEVDDKQKELQALIDYGIVPVGQETGKRVFHFSYAEPGQKERVFYFGNFSEDGIISCHGEYVRLSDGTTNRTITKKHTGIATDKHFTPFKSANPSNFCETILAYLLGEKRTKSGWEYLFFNGEPLKHWRSFLNEQVGSEVMPIKRYGRGKKTVSSASIKTVSRRVKESRATFKKKNVAAGQGTFLPNVRLLQKVFTDGQNKGTDERLRLETIKEMKSLQRELSQKLSAQAKKASGNRRKAALAKKRAEGLIPEHPPLYGEAQQPLSDTLNEIIQFLKSEGFVEPRVSYYQEKGAVKPEAMDVDVKEKMEVRADADDIEQAKEDYNNIRGLGLNELETIDQSPMEYW